jgi:EmrB/QacA subfamily drug resistance transporter
VSDSKKKRDLYPILLLTATSFGVAANGLNMSVFNIALPVVSAHFHASSMEASWIVLSYILFNSILILVFGRLADIYGRRKLYLLGVAEYAIASLLCGFAPNATSLIIFRILQAVGAALLITNTTPLITDAFPKKHLGRALGVNTFVLSVSQLIGPVLGGYLIVTFGWPWVFWINVPAALICFVWGFFKIRPSPKVEQREKIDVLGNLASLFGLGGFIIAFSVASEVGFVSWPVLIGLAVFVVCLIFFLKHEKRTDHPMIDLSLFKNNLYAMANLAALLASNVRAGMLLLVSLHAQYINFNDPQQAGFIVLPMAIGTAIASPIAGTLTRRWKSKYLSTSGLAVSCVGIIMILVYVSLPVSLLWLLAGEFLVGFGGGAFFVPNTTIIMLTVPDDRRGVANGIRSMLQNVGKLTSTALSMMLITVFLPIDLKNGVFRGQIQTLGGEDAALFTNGFQIAFLLMLVLSVIAILTSWSRGKKTGGISGEGLMP